MVTNELLEFIRQEQRKGLTPAGITETLEKAEWSTEDISKAFSELAPQFSSTQKLPELKTLLSETFSMYKNRLKTLSGVAFIGLLMQIGLFTIAAIGLAIFGAAGMLAKPGFLLLVLAALYLVVLFLIKSWSEAALLVSVSDQASIWDSFHRTRFLIFPFFLLVVITDIVTIGGYFFFFVPGVIFSVWFLYVKYIFLNEHLRGLKPFYQSREYTRGRWGETAGKFVVLPLILLGIWILFSFLIAIVPLLGTLKTFASIVLSLLVIIFNQLISPTVFAVFTFVIYRYARKPIPQGETGKRTKLAIWIGAVVGFLLAALLILLVVLVAKWIPNGCLDIEAGQCSTTPTTNTLSAHHGISTKQAPMQHPTMVTPSPTATASASAALEP